MKYDVDLCIREPLEHRARIHIQEDPGSQVALWRPQLAEID